jgi:hypothetical protein
MATRYYADLNPRYGAKYERRYLIVMHFDGAEPKMLTQPEYQFATRKAAERNAAILTKWEADVEADTTPALAKLPVECAARDLSTGEPILIRRGVAGFWPMFPSFDPEAFNTRHGISPAQVQAMMCGSMFGWDVPAADPATHEVPA